MGIVRDIMQNHLLQILTLVCPCHARPAFGELVGMGHLRMDLKAGMGPNQSGP